MNTPTAGTAVAESAEIMTPEQQAAQDLAAFIEAVQEEFDTIDVGDVPQNDEERTLYRYIRRHNQLESERQRVADQMQAMLRDFDNRTKALDYVYGPLAEETTKKLLAGKKQKSLKTPWGTVGFRTVKDRLVVTSDVEVLAAVDAGKLPPEVKRIKPAEVAMAALTEAFTKTGELPPGCEIKDGGEKFFVK